MITWALVAAEATSDIHYFAAFGCDVAIFFFVAVAFRGWPTD